MLKDLAEVHERSGHQAAKVSDVNPTFGHRLFDGEKRASDLTNIRLTIALVIDAKPADIYRAQMAGKWSTLRNAQLNDAFCPCLPA